MCDIELGDEVRDILTGFEGIAVMRAEYFNGCMQYEVQPKINEKKELPDSVYIDSQQLEIMKKFDPDEEKEETGGGSRNHPPKSIGRKC